MDFLRATKTTKIRIESFTNLKNLSFYSLKKLETIDLFARQKKLKKKHSRKVAVKNYNKFAFPKVFGLKDTVNLLSTYWHEIFKNIFSWQAEKNILLSTYWHKNHDDFHKIWDPVFDLHGIFPKKPQKNRCLRRAFKSNAGLFDKRTIGTFKKSYVYK